MYDLDVNTLVKQIIDVTNKNSGFVSVIIFIITIAISWLVGIFSFIIHKPKLKINSYSNVIHDFFVNEGLELSKEKEGHHLVKRTIFISSICINNIGYSPTTIESYSLYYKDINGKKHKLIPMSLPQPLTTKIGDSENIKAFPSLTTSYPHLGHITTWKIDVGTNIVGFLYFNIEHYGNYEPLIKNGKISCKLYIKDIWGKKYKYKINFIHKDINYLEQLIPPNLLVNQQSYV